ncbi:hypothetical protein [Streptomyces sp. C184]|uniref:hypothetical protein n=1 Tax=Streptomyces sp. C184 TaxID=3237121 RepID=UPI0034C66A86
MLSHFQEFGRNEADAELVKALHGLFEAGFPEKNTIGGLVLSSWLPSTFDQDDGDYDSFAAIPLLNRVADVCDVDGTDESGRTDAALDREHVILLADLLLFEAAALARHSESREQQVRTKACARSLVKAAELAPRAGAVLDVLPSAEYRSGAGSLADRSHELARLALDAVEPIVRHAVEITMLPTTTLHDEIMFIRCIQVFELVYRQVARCLERAVAAVSAGDPARATAEVTDAAARVVATGTLYRVLTTMPRDAFAVIRASTQGRSAIQSRAYREVERFGARLSMEQTDVPDWSLQEAYLDAFGVARKDDLADAMTELDSAWRAMKRTHWGITLKIIGHAPGTGGTSGVDFLKESAARPLFPMLHEAGRHG